MEKLKHRKEKHRYENNETEKECDSIDKSYSKWVDESLLIQMDSPSAVSQITPEKLPIFTQEFIRNLPEALVKKIIETRSECSINFSRETRLLSQNNSCKGKIRELNEEIERLKLRIEEIETQTQIQLKKTVKKEVFQLEETIKSQEKEVQKWKVDYQELEQKMMESEKEKLRLEGVVEAQAVRLRTLEESLKAFLGICEFGQIPFVKAKLEEMGRVQSRVQELNSINLGLKDKNFQVQKEFEMLQLADKNKDKHIELLEIQVKSLEESCGMLNLRVISLEQMLKDKDRSHQDLISNFRLLQDELKRVSMPKKKPDVNGGELERLKNALAVKLLEKSKKG